jgi:class 3 adenylate cyclase
MAVCGLPDPCVNHVEQMMRMAIRMIEISREYSNERGISLHLRVGLNSGPVVAGIIGSRKFIYDLWGDTVNLASRMESHGLPDTIQVTRPVFEKMRKQYNFEERGSIDVKGKGATDTWIFRG